MLVHHIPVELVPALPLLWLLYALVANFVAFRFSADEHRDVVADLYSKMVISVFLVESPTGTK